MLDKKWRVRLVLLFFKEEGGDDIIGVGTTTGGAFFTGGMILSIKILEEEDSIDFVFLFDGFRFSGAFSWWFFFAFLAVGGPVDDGG